MDGELGDISEGLGVIIWRVYCSSGLAVSFIDDILMEVEGLFMYILLCLSQTLKQ